MKTSSVKVRVSLNSNPVHITGATDKGGRSHQEDRFVFRSFEFGDLLAVFDGHSGSNVAETVSITLVQIFESSYRTMEKAGNNMDYEKLLRGVTSALDELVKDMAGGSTMSLVFVPKANGGCTAYVAVIGDSPVVVTDSEGKIFLGPNHNVRENLAERQAAEARGGHYSGGYIFNRQGNSGLQMGRDLGNVRLFGGILSHEPEIMSVKLGDESIIIVASDGVFDPSHRSDTMAEAKRFVGMVKNGSTAEDLVKDALDRDTGDNATAVVWRTKRE